MPPKERAMEPTAACLKRIQAELRKLRASEQEFKGPKGGTSRDIIQVAETIWLRQDNEQDLTSFTALICGNDGTPYEHGFYLFKLNIPSDYPFVPPKVKILTTDGSTRINPNLYANGKVCLSILGTWHGPSWAMCMSIRTVLMQIQTLFTEDPLQNEPGFDKTEKKNKKKVGGSGGGGSNWPSQQRQESMYKTYAETVAHANVRLMLLQMQGKLLREVAKPFMALMRRLFLKNYDKIVCMVETKLVKHPNASTLFNKGIFNTREVVDYRSRLAEMQKVRSDLLLAEHTCTTPCGEGTSSDKAGTSKPNQKPIETSNQKMSREKKERSNEEKGEKTKVFLSSRQEQSKKASNPSPSLPVPQVAIDLTDSPDEVEVEVEEAPPRKRAKKTTASSASEVVELLD